MTIDDATVARMESRMRAIEDRYAIVDVLVQYAFSADLHRADEWLSLWTADATYEPSETAEVLRGKDDLTRLITAPSRAPAGASQHYLNAPLAIELDGDEAVARGYSFRLMTSEDGDSYLTSAAFNRWSLRRVEGQWKVVKRERRRMGGGNEEDVI